ncbi:uncharacterized protein F5891DRAFT_615673 [Suillus fuscotomentosus]|uniref:Uncharacterized protein n=1 Tax=Suillus fuscotomentosus TaxID=1912939 RepID=A0AAD4DMP4_9AGAM|nr:uncharacterized protein F5891DRAFT_615673 [Suillus fuscotomentosus]KAG1882542.1 hypothetical protein F5891DRAFT_615673 [Suillus fuscotomentosus]
MADSSPHAITFLEALAVILLADAETPDDQLFAATISLQALDAKQRGAKYGPRGPYDQQKAEQFFELFQSLRLENERWPLWHHGKVPYLPHRLIVHGQHIFWGVVVTVCAFLLVHVGISVCDVEHSYLVAPSRHFGSSLSYQTPYSIQYAECKIKWQIK